MSRVFTLVSSLVFFFGFAFGTPQQAEAWHGCYSFGHGSFGHGTFGYGGHHSSWGGYGMGGGFRSVGFGGGYNSFYTPNYWSSPSCYTTSFSSYSPRCLSYGASFTNCASSYYSNYNSYSYPTCYSSYYSPYYYSPVVYRPIQFSPVVFPRPCVPPIYYQVPQIPLCFSNPPVVPTLVSTPARESWLSSAVELIDLMVQQGGVDQGLQACEQLISVRKQLPSEIYWRAAVLASLSGRDAQKIVAFVELAEKAGDRFEGHQLPGGSLREYAKRANGKTVEETLNRIAKSALTSDHPTAEYRSLSAMLTLDGQASRARVFLAAANNPSNLSQPKSVTKLASVNR